MSSNKTCDALRDLIPFVQLCKESKDYKRLLFVFFIITVTVNDKYIEPRLKKKRRS